MVAVDVQRHWVYTTSIMNKVFYANILLARVKTRNRTSLPLERGSRLIFPRSKFHLHDNARREVTISDAYLEEKMSHVSRIRLSFGTLFVPSVTSNA